jgi:hypothetical protein
MGDEGRSFGFGDQVVDPKPPRAAWVKSQGGERCGNVGTTIPAGTVERGERKHRQLRRHFRHVAGGSMSGASGFASGGAPGSSTCNKIGRFVQRSCGNLGPGCCFSQPKQDRPLTHEALFSDHVAVPVVSQRADAIPRQAGIRSGDCCKVNFNLAVFDIIQTASGQRSTVQPEGGDWSP